MNLKQTVIATAAVALLALACGDVPAGGDRGDSAGDNQPNPLPGCAVPANAEPAAQVDDGKYVYDFYVELWDENCNSAAMVGDSDLGDDAGPPALPPVHIFLEGHVQDKNGQAQPAYFLDNAKKEKDVNTPYHVRGFVSPRGAPHWIILLASVNAPARGWVGESLEGGALHCRITRDSRPIVDAKNVSGRVVDRTTHTVALVNGAASVSCHLTVGVS